MDVAKREATQRRVVASRLVTLFLAGWASAPPAPDCHQPIDQAVFRYNYTLRPKFEIKPFSSAACHRMVHARGSSPKCNRSDRKNLMLDIGQHV